MAELDKAMRPTWRSGVAITHDKWRDLDVFSDGLRAEAILGAVDSLTEGLDSIIWRSTTEKGTDATTIDLGWWTYTQAEGEALVAAADAYLTGRGWTVIRGETRLAETDTKVPTR